MKEDNKTAKPDTEWKKDAKREKEKEREGERRNTRAKLTGLDMVTY